MNNFLISGYPGSGKTTLILKIAKQLSGYRIGGFFTREIREHGQRVGFQVETFTGKSGILSHTRFTTGPAVGKYRVDVPQFEQIAVTELETALAADSIILIDEIGKMELYSNRFKKILPSCFNSRNILIATVMERSIPFVDSLKSRPDIQLIKVTIQNRNNLAITLVSEINNQFSIPK